MKNFPIKISDGKVYWISRSVAVTCFVFTIHEGVKYVLANRRGPGTPDFQGMWNIPCGYLEFDENGEEACVREVFEETGIQLHQEYVVFYGVNTEPTQNKQNVSLRYTYYLEDGFSQKFTTEHSEADEVAEIAWIPVNQVDNYEWAFNHLELIKEIL